MKILLKKHFGWFYEKLKNDAIDSYAAQVSFWILISFIPFLMLVLALLQVIRFEDLASRGIRSNASAAGGRSCQLLISRGARAADAHFHDGYHLRLVRFHGYGGADQGALLCF